MQRMADGDVAFDGKSHDRQNGSGRRHFGQHRLQQTVRRPETPRVRLPDCVHLRRQTCQQAMFHTVSFHNRRHTKARSTAATTSKQRSTLSKHHSTLLPRSICFDSVERTKFRSTLLPKPATLLPKTATMSKQHSTSSKE